MQDILLWRMLTGSATQPDADDLCARIEELARLPLRDRLPFMGLAGDLVFHPSEGVRASALKVLAGSDGLGALRCLVKSLDDACETVRQIAVESLSVSVQHDPSRFAHALFHPQADVRRHALAKIPDDGIRWYALFLLGDDDVHAEALECLASAEVSTEYLDIILGFVDEGRIPRDLACALIGRMGADAVLRNCVTDWDRARISARAILRAAEKDDARSEICDLAAPSKLVGRVIDLFWMAGDLQADEPECEEAQAGTQAGFFDELLRFVVSYRHGAHGDVVAGALIQAAVKHGIWPDPAIAGICALAYPRFLGFTWVPRDLRRQAVDVLYAHAQSFDHGKRFVEQLLHLDICRRETGQLDLWVLGGILHFIKRYPYKSLLEWFCIDEIVTAALENVDEAVPFLSLEDKSKQGQSFLIERIAAAAGIGAADVMAMLLCASATDRLEKLDFLRDLAPKPAGAVAGAVLRLTNKPGVKMSYRKQTLLGNMLCKRMGAAEYVTFMNDLLTLETPHKNTFGMTMTENVTQAMDVESFAEWVALLEVVPRHRLLIVIGHCDGFPFGKEMYLANALANHSDPETREWAEARIPPPREADPEEKTTWMAAESAEIGVITLTRKQAHTIETCADKDLPNAVKPCLSRPTCGLAKALVGRSDPLNPVKVVASALMVSSDPLVEVDRELVRFGSDEETFIGDVEQYILKRYERKALPLQGHAMLHRFDFHCFAFRDAVLANKTGLAGLLKDSLQWHSGMLRAETWSAAEHLMGIWRWREPSLFPERCTDDLIDALGKALFTRDGTRAGGMLMKIHNAKAAPDKLAALRERVLPRLLDMDEPTRKRITAWIDSTGLVVCRRPRPQRKANDEPDPATVATWTDVKRLGECCRHQRPELAESAALRLIELGTPGLSRLIGVICAEEVPPCIAVLCGTLPLWPETAALRRLRVRVKGEQLPPESQMFAAIGLLQRDEPEWRLTALRAPCRDVREHWFTLDHWQALLDAGIAEDEIAIALTVSPQPPAYMPALEAILTHPQPDSDMERAVEAFLECDSRRIRDLRIRSAHWLCQRGNYLGLPLLIWDMVFGQKVLSKQLLINIFCGSLPIPEVNRVVDTFLTGGPILAEERILADGMLSPEFRNGHDGRDVDAVLRRILSDAKLQRTRNAIVAGMKTSPLRQGRFHQLAETFAWGVITGRELTGRTFNVQMHAGSALGYTRLNEDKLFITPMPILRGDTHGREIVEGLILHEIGHHLYHRDHDGGEINRQASREGLSRLLNLVQDEHLERRMRSYDERFGDRFKRLASHAFLYTQREWDVERLLECLRLNALPVLRTATLGVAHEDGCVRIESAHLLQELERQGSSFSRFFRALRMGLGDRYGDSKVREALGLFGKSFQNSTHRELLDVARRLKALFPKEALLLELLSQDGILQASEDEVIILGEGLSNEELQREIDRILNPHKSEMPDEPGVDRVINLSPDESFNLIQTVVRLDNRPERHAAYARKLGRNPQRMREYFEKLGLAYTPQRMRVSGRQFDRTRIPSVVLRGDPRMLIARRIEIQTDLFLGLLVDCSGSMHAVGRIEQAKLFAVLLAEAAKNMRSIDVRVFGFTDSVIFDAGNARHCAAHALESGGGNNDAAALWHAATEARRSRRKAKLLVMISDGSPTECSTHALRALVTRLQSRMGIACAQVAVAPLDEICFPSYVEIHAQDQDKAVTEFGKIIVKLVGKTIGRRSSV